MRINKTYKFLKDDESTHHIDGNTHNNHIKNIEVLSHDEHMDKHSEERSQRMKLYNPMFNKPKEHFIKLGKMQKI